MSSDMRIIELHLTVPPPLLLLLLLCLDDAFWRTRRSCIKKQRGQHTAVFATANALYRGAKIAEEAFASSIAAGVPFSGSRRCEAGSMIMVQVRWVFMEDLYVYI